MNRDSSHPSADQTPWYRQFWPWFLILLPATAVVGGITTVIIAIQNADDLVVDDWYKQGRGINRSMAEEQLAARLGLALTLSQRAEDKVSVRMRAATPIPWPEQLTLSLRHPTLSEHDLQLTLAHQEGGHYLGAGQLADGHWDVTVTPAAGQWRLYQRITLEDRSAQVGVAH